MSADQGTDTAAVSASPKLTSGIQQHSIKTGISLQKFRLGQTERPMSTVLADKPADLTWTPGTMDIEMEGQRQLHKAFL